MREYKSNANQRRSYQIGSNAWSAKGGEDSHSKVQQASQQSRWNSSPLRTSPVRVGQVMGDAVNPTLPWMLRASAADLKQSPTTHP